MHARQVQEQQVQHAGRASGTEARKNGKVVSGSFTGYSVRLEDYGPTGGGCLVVYSLEGTGSRFDDWLPSAELLKDYLARNGRVVEWSAA